MKERRVRSDYFYAIQTTLGAVKYFEAHIEQLRLQRQYIEETDGIGAIDYSTGSSSGSKGIGSVTESTAIKKIEALADIDQRIKHHESRKNLVERAVMNLKEPEQSIIKLYYLEDKGWNDVTKIMNMSESTCRRKRDAGLNNLAIIMYGERALVSDIAV